MSFFDEFIVRPILNLLMAIYSLIPDFGISIIVFTILVRLLLWPLIKKQLHQAKAMRKMQPELAKIKKQYAKNPQMRNLAMMELYKKHNISAFGSIGVLIIQLPILIAMYRVVQIFVSSRADLGKYVYDFVKNLPVANNLVNNPDQFNQNFLGVIDLTQHAVSKDGVIIGLLILAGVAAYLQYLTSKQLSPQSDSKRKLRDILAEAGGGKEADQSEVNAIMTRKMMKFMPLMMFMVTIYLPAALALYLATASAVGYLQNHIILKQDSLEMEAVANKKTASQKSIASAKTKKRAKQATEARITRIKAKG
ncbi:membrane protein [Candidatus Nanosynbacter lyticus]|uniref:Membrane protein n=1 Tax=Candidatus Nanosynbacter lyticus TaxID=2093824 RepID=A0A6S4GRP7_9BACT|nr:YidC/Oxa1 family membrane protein insertase [Candidatus Nanosynbacter lyticus]AJA06670.1 membrane protein [Candidatus Nanosynbacter lyticus]QCT41851.1 YidC/Oxa1 family membrane protein insertase [TM7 phylum sp. oral taxon 952]